MTEPTPKKKARRLSDEEAAELYGTPPEDEKPSGIIIGLLVATVVTYVLGSTFIVIPLGLLVLIALDHWND